MRPGPCSADHGAGRRHRRPVRGRRLPGPQPRLPLGLAGFIAAFACLIAMNAPQTVWQAGGATALFIAGFGAAGYATRRDLSALARILFWALIGLILFGIVAIFVAIPNGALVYAVLGLV